MEINEEGHIKGWNDGLVIQDDIGNEFAWIPVENILEFNKEDGYFGGEKQEYLIKISESDYVNQID